MIEFIERGGLVTIPSAGELSALRELLDHYADAPMDFADACVVRLAELHSNATVCTTDGHFQFYRKHRRDPIPLLAPFTA